MIENVWLDFAKTYEELKELKDSMIVCDNVSKHLYTNYKPKPSPGITQHPSPNKQGSRLKTPYMR